jgi:hypothetical protein
VTYLPVVDSHAVDRAVAAGGGPPLFVQIKSHAHARPGDRLAFAIPLSQVGGYPRWLALLLEGSPAGLREAYLVPGADLLASGERGRLVDGRPCVRATLSPTSPTWSRFWVPLPDLGARLESLAAPPELAAAPPLERSQEEGGFFEEAVVAALLAEGAALAVYRPAVDLGRDLLVQRAGSAAYLYLQVKGSLREDRPGLVRFQVRRRAFARDPALWFLFCSGRGGVVGPVWLVPAATLEERAAAGDALHLSFEAHIEGADPRWSEFRLSSLADLAGRLLSKL